MTIICIIEISQDTPSTYQDKTVTPIQFLCRHHLQLLHNNPKLALDTWDNAIANGHQLYHAGKPFQAVNHFGAAVEAADVMLDLDVVQPIQRLHNFVLASLFLALSLNGSEQFSASKFFLAKAQQRIEIMKVVKPLSTTLKAYIEECLLMINKTYLRMFDAEENPSGKTDSDKNFVGLSRTSPYSTDTDSERNCAHTLH